MASERSQRIREEPNCIYSTAYLESIASVVCNKYAVCCSIIEATNKTALWTRVTYTITGFYTSLANFLPMLESYDYGIITGVSSS